MKVQTDIGSESAKGTQTLLPERLLIGSEKAGSFLRSSLQLQTRISTNDAPSQELEGCKPARWRVRGWDLGLGFRFQPTRCDSYCSVLAEMLPARS